MSARVLVAIIACAVIGSAWSPGAFDTSTPQYGRLAAASVTHSSAGTADAIVTLTGRRRIIVCTNNLNQDTVITYNGSNWVFLPAATSIAVDLSASGLTFADGKIIGIYYLVQPTTGSVGCTAH